MLPSDITTSAEVRELSAEELEELEEKRRERKERKKQRKKEAKTTPGAVIPPEPVVDVTDVDASSKRVPGSPDAFVTLCRLGQGAFGRVNLVRWRGDGRPYAMKLVRVEDCASPAMAEQLLVERRVLTELAREPHPLLASARCCFRSARHLHFVMPFLQGGTLASHLNQQPSKTLPEASVRFYAAQLSLALGTWHPHRAP